jgi:hypothetical protein
MEIGRSRRIWSAELLELASHFADDKFASFRFCKGWKLQIVQLLGVGRPQLLVLSLGSLWHPGSFIPQMTLDESFEKKVPDALVH